MVLYRIGLFSDLGGYSLNNNDDIWLTAFSGILTMSDKGDSNDHRIAGFADGTANPGSKCSVSRWSVGWLDPKTFVSRLPLRAFPVRYATPLGDEGIAD